MSVTLEKAARAMESRLRAAGVPADREFAIEAIQPALVGFDLDAAQLGRACRVRALGTLASISAGTDATAAITTSCVGAFLTGLMYGAMHVEESRS